MHTSSFLHRSARALLLLLKGGHSSIVMFIGFTCQRSLSPRQFGDGVLLADPPAP